MWRIAEIDSNFIGLQQRSEALEGAEIFKKEMKLGLYTVIMAATELSLGTAPRGYGYVFATIGFQDTARSKPGWDKGSTR
jgi:hypothetical protein